MSFEEKRSDSPPSDKEYSNDSHTEKEAQTAIIASDAGTDTGTTFEVNPAAERALVWEF